MRIISGYFKGKKILTPKDIKTRPLKDITKESMFNVIKHSNKFNIQIKNSTVLDLFSGVGSFGIECLSNEAKYVTFVENYQGVLPILEQNLENLKNLNGRGPPRLSAAGGGPAATPTLASIYVYMYICLHTCVYQDIHRYRCTCNF